MYEQALRNRASRIYTAQTLEEAAEKVQNRMGFVKMMWCGDEACEDAVREKVGIQSRCIPFEQEHVGDACPVCGKPAKHMVIWGQSY